MLYSEDLYSTKSTNSLPSQKRDPQETGFFNEVGKGFGAGVDQLQGLIGGGGKALVGSLVGNDEWFREGLQYYDEQMSDASLNAADVGSLEEIDGFGDMLNYSAYIIGNLGSSLIGGGVSGAVGGAIAKGGLKRIAKEALESSIKPSAKAIAEQSAKYGLRGQIGGAVAFGTAAGAGESFTKVLDEGGEEAPIAALITGVASGALDQYTPMRALKRILPQQQFKSASKKISESIGNKRNVAKRILVEGAKSGGAEGVVEGLQEVLQNATLETIRSDHPEIEGSWLERMTTEENLSAYLNAAVAGIIGGAAIGGVSGIARDPVISEDPTSEQDVDEAPQPDEPTEPTLAQERRRKQLSAAGIPMEDRATGKTPQQAINDAQTSQRNADLEDPNVQMDVGDPNDPELRRRKQAEAREKTRAAIDRLPQQRDQSNPVSQREFRDVNGEIVSVPKKQVEPEVEPQFGGNLPSDITPPIDQMTGKDVDYQGVKGILTKRENGYFVVSQDEDVIVEGGETLSPDQLGLSLINSDLVFENDIGFDPKTRKFNLREKEFTLTAIRRDRDGNPISLSVRDAKGKQKTIRESEIVRRVSEQSIPAPSISGGVVALDDLPTSVQEIIVDRAGESNAEINEEIAVEDALEVANSLPEDQREFALSEITDLSEASLRFTPTDEKFFSESKYVGSVRRPSNISLSESIAEVNKGLGEGRTPIDEGRLRETLSINNNATIDGVPLVGVSEFYGDGIQAEEILNAVVDLVEMGMPKSVLKDFNGIGIHDPAVHPSAKRSDGAYNLISGTISLKKGYVNSLRTDNPEAERIRYTIAHEIGHAYDINNNITDNSVEFSAEINSITSDGLDIELGDVIHELAQSYQNKNELGREMSYPFGEVFDWVNATPLKAEARIDVMKKEAFAQAFAVFHSNPDLLETSAPLTYNYLVKLLRTQQPENTQNAKNDNQAEADVGERGAVQEDVRTPPQPRSVEVSDGEGDQLVSQDGARQEETSQGLGGETQRQDGDDTGQPVQLSDEDALEARLVEEELGDEEVTLTEVSDDPLDFLTDYDGSDFLFAPVSTRFPTGKKRTEDPIADLLVNDYESFANAGALFSKNIALIKSYTNLTKEEQVGSDEVVAERFINHMVDNLLYIYDSVPDSTRELSKQWYEGANKIVQRMADKHGISLAQASAVAANLSPQKDWYQNASLAERVMDIYHENINDSFDQNMKDKAEVIYFHKDVKPPARITNRRKLDLIQGKSLQQLIDEKASPHVLGMWVRTWDQTYNSPNYRLVSPDGKFLEYAVNEDGKTRSKAGWGSLSEIGKALTAIMNPKIEALSESLGDANKVRNFYNNIFDPASKLGFVTIDTHAVAAALMRPLGGKAEEVGGNFGTQKGSSSSKVTGHKGTYSLYEEAYRRAAKEKGVLPREMQSITWEAVRGLFTSTYKAQKQNVVFVQGVWNQYNKGKLSLDEARIKINEHSGGVERPSWERSDFTIPDEASDTSYERIVPDGDISRPESGLQETAGSGTGIDATRVPTDTEFLSSPPREDDSNISDLSARREQKGLQDFKSRMMDTIQQQVSSKNKIVKQLISDGAFEGFEVGKRYASKHSGQETFGFKSEITGLSITSVSKYDRGQGSAAMNAGLKPFGIIPESEIFVGDDGKEYTANLRTTVINPKGEKSESSAALWKVKKQLANGDAKFMGGLRPVSDDDFLSSPPREEDSSISEDDDRIQRAKDMGFDTDTVFYHGTDVNFSEFYKDSRGSSTGDPDSKLGFFFSSNPDVASSYASINITNIDYSKGLLGAVNKLTNGLYKKINESANSLARRAGFDVPAEFNSPQVLPVYTKSNNRSVVDAKGSRYTVLQFTNYINRALDAGADSVLIKNVIDEGFAVRGSESSAISDVLVVFSPENIRSVNAQFDPAKSESSDLLSSPPRQESAPNLTPEEANAAQNARIREEKSFVDSATSWASRTFRRNLAPQGLLNDEVFESKIKRDGEIGAVEIDIRMYIASYDEAIKNAYPEGTEVPESVLNDALQVPVEQLEDFDLPKEVKDVVGRMRRYIDKYSADYSEVIQSQLDALDSETQTKEIEAKQSLLSTFKSNLGKYLNRSYRAFDDPNWAKSVPDNVLNDAKEYLAENGATNVERVINTILKEGTAFDGIGSFIVNSKLGAKDLSILKKKNNTIAPEILALLGEYKEPRINFVKTATKLSRLVFNHKFLEQVKQQGEGVFLFTAETAPSDAYVKLAADQSSVMAPLNGFFVTPELKQGFDEANGLDSLDGMYRNIVALNSIVKYGKTVIAPTTIARNFMSAGFFTIANGHFDWSKTQKSMAVFKSYFNSKEGDATAYLRELKRLGVIYDTPIAGELIKAMEDSGIEALQNELVGSEMAKGTISKAKTKMQQWASAAAKFYQYGDDFWKIVGFQNEMDMLMEAKGLSYEEAAPLAAERIRNTYPTYSLIGRAMQQLRRFPLAGTFVSFPAEIIRTSFNMFKYLKQDMADPDMRASAHRRLAGMAMVSGGIYAIQAAAFAAWDVSEEEEEAIRLMSPEWSRNSNIVVTGRDEKGDLEYIDLTYLDPYAYWKRPINALLRDQPVDDALAQSAQEMLTPFFGKDISAGTVFNLMVNEKDSGGRIYNPADTPTNVLADMTGFMLKQMAPSAFQNANRIGKALNGEVSKSGKKFELDDEMLALVGFRTTTFDPKVSLHFKAYEFNQDKRDATSILTTTFRDPNDVSNGDLINAFERASGARKEGFERMIKLVSAARSSGLTDTQLTMVLRSNGVTRKDARSLVKGDYKAWAMSDSTLKNTVKKSDLLFGKAKGKTFEDRWKLIQELLRREN